MTRLLVVDEDLPYPVNTGKRTRCFNLYRRLAERFEICYLGYGGTGETGEAVQALAGAGIQPVTVPARLAPKAGPAFYLRLLANLLSPLPYIVSSHYSRPYRAAVQETVARWRPDLVVYEWTPYVAYARAVCSILPGVPQIVSAHNVEADIWRRYHDHETRSLHRWYIRRQWHKVDRFERQALGRVDGAVAVSPLDQQRLTPWCLRGPVTVVANGVDLDYFRPLPQPLARQRLVFTGSMDWRPNQDAARYFIQAILPRLRRVRPDLQCSFVGRSPPPELVDLALEAGVTVTGTVADVRPHVAEAAVYIVPLRIGGGSRLKILEALAMGRAVVSTTVGAEGLETVHGRHLLLADDPEDFARAVLALLDDPDRCRALADAGRQLVERHYGWDALAGRFGQFVHQIVGG